MGTGNHIQVGSLHHGVQVGPGSREAPAVVDVSVKGVEALLPVTVHVTGKRVAGLLHRLEEGTEQGAGRGASFKDQRAVTTTPVVLPSQAGLHAPEVGQAVGVVPGLTSGGGCPAVVVHRVATLEYHPVDARGATQHLAACVVHATATHLGFRLGLVLPVVEPVAYAEREGGRHVDEHVPPVVGATGLEHQYPVRGIGAEAVGQGATG